MSLYGLDDAGFQQACFRAYNDWLGEFCSYDPKRLFGIALIPPEVGQAGRGSEFLASGIQPARNLHGFRIVGFGYSKV